jgi:hypothetical protein
MLEWSNISPDTSVYLNMYVPYVQYKYCFFQIIESKEYQKEAGKYCVQRKEQDKEKNKKERTPLERKG